MSVYTHWCIYLKLWILLERPKRRICLAIRIHCIKQAVKHQPNWVITLQLPMPPTKIHEGIVSQSIFTGMSGIYHLPWILQYKYQSYVPWKHICFKRTIPIFKRRYGICYFCGTLNLHFSAHLLSEMAFNLPMFRCTATNMVFLFRRQWRVLQLYELSTRNIVPHLSLFNYFGERGCLYIGCLCIHFMKHFSAHLLSEMAFNLPMFRCTATNMVFLFRRQWRVLQLYELSTRNIVPHHSLFNYLGERGCLYIGCLCTHFMKQQHALNA